VNKHQSVVCRVGNEHHITSLEALQDLNLARRVEILLHSFYLFRPKTALALRLVFFQRYVDERHGVESSLIKTEAGFETGNKMVFVVFATEFENRLLVGANNHHGRPRVDSVGSPVLEVPVVEDRMTNVEAQHCSLQDLRLLLVLKLS